MERIAKITIQVEGSVVSTRLEGKPTISELIMAINSLICHTQVVKHMPRPMIMRLIKIADRYTDKLTMLQIDDRSEEVDDE